MHGFFGMKGEHVGSGIKDVAVKQGHSVELEGTRVMLGGMAKLEEHNVKRRTNGVSEFFMAFVVDMGCVMMSSESSKHHAQ